MATEWQRPRLRFAAGWLPYVAAEEVSLAAGTARAQLKSTVIT
jgi:hypothetical protein